MKLNYKNISCSPMPSIDCPDCIYELVQCYTVCEYCNFRALVEIKRDIFDENIL